MSSGRSTRLSLKRKHDTDMQCLPGTSHDLTDDFRDASTVFRIPKKLKTKNTSTSIRPRGRPRKSDSKDATESDVSDKEKESPELLDGGRRDIVGQRYDPCFESESRDSEDGIEEKKLLIDLERSVCSESEKICPCCKHIVPSAILTDHFKECLQKFKLSKRGCVRQPTANASAAAKKEENQGKTEVEGKSDESSLLPCPVCMKTFRSKIRRHSHVKACAQSHGFSLEKLLLASKLLEKQVEERRDFGLPLPLQQTHGNNENVITAGKEKRIAKLSIRAAKKDPDLAMAIALSRSVAEEEVTARVEREERLLTLGLDQILEEERKTQPVLLPFLEADSKKKNASQSRNRRQKSHFQNTALAMCSVEERERRISEKVAAMLAADDTPRVIWKTTKVSGGKGHLSGYKNEACKLWEAAHSYTDQPLEEFYVPELEQYIKPKETAVGGLLRSLSQIPGRLNVTAIHAMDEENSDSGSECEETSVMDGYCTQLALAELMGSQECLDFTLAHDSLEDQNIPQGPDSTADPNSTLEAGNGFWFVQPAGDQGINENPENHKSKLTAVDHDETHQVIDNSRVIVGSSRYDLNNCDETTDDTEKDRLGRVTFKESSESTNNNVNISIDSTNEIVDFYQGNQEDCIELDENMSRLDDGKYRSFMESPSNENRIFNVSKSDYPRSCNTVESEDQERDVKAVVADKCHEDSSNDIDKTPEIDITYENEINDHASEGKDENSVRNEVMTTPHDIPEKLIEYDLENMPSSASDWSSVKENSKFSPKKLHNPSGSELLATDDKRIKENDTLETRNVYASQNLDDENYTCRVHLIGKLYTEKTHSCSESESSDIDDKSKLEMEGRETEQKHGLFTFYKSLVKDYESCANFSQDIMHHSQQECKEVDGIALQSNDYHEQSQSSTCCRPLPQLMDRNCNDKRILSVRGRSSIENREHCEEIGFLRKAHSVGVEDLSKQPKDELEASDNFEKTELPLLNQTKSKQRDVCLKNGRSSQESQTECEELKPMREKFLHDWSMLLTSEEGSDVMIMTAKSSMISAHSLIFLARCPKLYKEVRDAKMQITWDRVSNEGAYAFLVYLYTGTCTIKAKDSPVWSDVFDLALQYDCKDLISYLESLYKAHSTCIKEDTLTKNTNISEVMDDLLNLDHGSHLVKRRSASDPGNIKESERPVKRCLNMSTIDGEKKASGSSTSLASNENFQEEELAESQKEQGCQSPDIFDETAPLSPTMQNPSPWEESAHLMHCEPDAGITSAMKSVGSQKVSVYNTKNISGESPQLRSDSHKSGEDSNVNPGGEKLVLQCSRISDVSKQSACSSGKYHSDHEIRSTKSLEVESQNHGIDSTEMKDNVIDLTLSSPDRSSTTESLSGELANSPCPDLNDEEMEPLRLGSDEDALKVDGDGSQQELTTAGDSVSFHTKNLTESTDLDKELECVDEHYISNVWDGFDDVGSSAFAPIDISPTPQKCIEKTSADGCTVDEVDFGVSKVNRFMASKYKNEATSILSHNDTLDELTTDLDDSVIRKEFEEEIEVCRQRPQKRKTVEAIHEPLPRLMTPQGKSTGDDKGVTPMPDYKTMSSPKLKKELQKYGIRPVSRKKALFLLQHMYEQTHPFVTDSEAESSFMETPQHKNPSKHASRMEKEAMHEKVITKSKKITSLAGGSKKKKTDVKDKDKVMEASTKKKDADKEIVDSSSQLQSSQSSITSTDGSEFECLEESLALEMDDDDNSTLTQQADLRSLVTQFITSDPELHQRMLLYEPVFVEELLLSLKANGVRCSMKNLIDILDDQCITFRTQQGHQRSRARTRRSPRKKKAQSPNKNKKAQTN